MFIHEEARRIFRFARAQLLVKYNKTAAFFFFFFAATTERFDIPPYEEMALYYPQANQKRPLILVGPPSIGRHELRLHLLEDKNRFAAAVPRKFLFSSYLSPLGITSEEMKAFVPLLILLSSSQKVCR